MEHACFVGIDVSQTHLDVHVRPTGDSFRVNHDDTGVGTLLERVRPLAPTVLVLEATGGYEVPVAATLASAGLPVAVVNPRQIRDFARATGQLAKTDTLDARVIALFAEAVRPAARPVPDEQAQALGELIARRRSSSRCSAPSTIAAASFATAACSATSMPISPGSRRPSVASITTSPPSSAPPLCGAKPTTYSAPSRASGPSPLALSSPIFPNWVASTAGASRRWPGSPPSPAIAAPSGAAA